MFDFLKHIYFMFFIVSLASMFVTIMVAVTAKEVADRHVESKRLSEKGFLKKDLDQALRLYRWFDHHVNRANILMDKGQFYDARRDLEQTIKITHLLETLKHDKLLHDLKQELARQKEVDLQGIVDKVLRWRRW